MKRNAIIRIIIYCFLIFVLLSIFFSVLSYDSYSTNARWHHEESYQATIQEVAPMNIMPNEEGVSFAPADVRELEIEWADGSVIIQPADIDAITISESDVSDENHSMRYQLKNGTLSIVFCEESLFRGFGLNFNLSKDLYIFVPRDWECGSLEIDTASATVEVNDLTIRQVEFDGASGICRFENCIVDTMDMDTASGDVTITGNLNVLDFDGASASIYAKLSNTPNRMDIDTASGNLDLTLPENTGFIVNMDALSSNFSSDFETIQQNGNYVHGDGRCRIQIDAMSGDVIIRKAQ